MENDIKPQPRVISYRRFSSMRQARGHSIERQTDAADEWCTERGWNIDTSLVLTDRGKSGFTGANRDKGALKTLIEKLEKGEIKPGTYLLIEALDRLTRQELTSAVPLFLDLLEAGLVIVTLVDGKEWTKAGMNRDMGDFMYSIMLLSRGHEESLRKAHMIRKKFASARADGKKIFGSAPGWLERKDKNSPWCTIPERVESVQKIFELAAQGFGSKAIAKQANKDKWVLPTRDTSLKTNIWHGALAGRILRLREVLGEHEHRIQTDEAKKRVKHWKGERSGMVITDYYPRIISDELWHRARATIERKTKTYRRRDEHYMNIWSGLLRCGHCGAMIQRKSESRGESKAQLICSNKMVGITSCKTGAAGKADSFLLLDICAYAGADMGLGYDKQAIVNEIEIASSRLKDNKKSSENIAEAIANAGAAPFLLAKARELIAEQDVLEKLVAQHKQTLSQEPNSLLDDTYAQGMLDILYIKTDEAKVARADCNTRLLRAVEGIWYFAYDCAMVKFRNSNALLHVSLMAKNKKDENSHPMQQAWMDGKLQIPGLNAPLDLPISISEEQK